MKPLDINRIKKLRGDILNAKKISLLMHYNPDGDAIGATLASYLLLKKLNKNVEIISPNHFPGFLAWLPGSTDIVIGEDDKEKATRIILESDLIIMHDFNALNRLKVLEETVRVSKAKKILIDHHPNPENIADHTISDTSVSSAAELVYHFYIACEWGDMFDKQISECVYTGIMTDTGCFSFNSSNPDTFKTVAALLENGIQTDKVYEKVYHNYSVSRMRLMGHVLRNNMHIIERYHTAYIRITREDLQEYNFQPGDTEGFVNLPLSISGVRFSVLFVEKDDHIKISLRSTGDFPANEFSGLYFNGGGHLNAAGGESYLNLDETVKLFVTHLEDYSKKLS